jgi:membrane protein implicated in regulation of membrane protease activity
VPAPARLASETGNGDARVRGRFPLPGLEEGATVESWVVWLIVAVLLGAAELLTATLALGLAAMAAAVAAVIGAAGLSLPVQVGGFMVATVAGLGMVRPFAIRHIRRPPLLRSGTSALVGRSALVLDEVSTHGGRVRIGGEEWTSRPYDEDLIIPAGVTVEVIGIDGATALVTPGSEPWRA